MAVTETGTWRLLSREPRQQIEGLVAHQSLYAACAWNGTKPLAVDLIVLIVRASPAIEQRVWAGKRTSLVTDGPSERRYASFSFRGLSHERRGHWDYRDVTNKCWASSRGVLFKCVNAFVITYSLTSPVLHQMYSFACLETSDSEGNGNSHQTNEKRKNPRNDRPYWTFYVLFNYLPTKTTSRASCEIKLPTSLWWTLSIWKGVFSPGIRPVSLHSCCATSASACGTAADYFFFLFKN